MKNNYIVFVDNSMGFDDLSNLKVGDVFYEQDMGMLCKGVVVTEPKNNKTIDASDSIDFEANVSDFDFKQMVFKDRDEAVSYRATRNFMHYGGSFYKDFCIYDRDTQTVVELEMI